MSFPRQSSHMSRKRSSSWSGAGFASSRAVRGRAVQPRLQNGDHIPSLVLMPPEVSVVLRAVRLSIRAWSRLIPIISRILFGGNEGLLQRLKALAHTFLGVCYAIQLRDRKIEHIHVHHGYFASWVAMTAARLLGVSYSLTLHGSDLLLNASYLDAKLAACKFCLT